jgi:trehalose/maltose hydrolase-like predicted phosphorylase
MAALLLLACLAVLALLAGATNPADVLSGSWQNESSAGGLNPSVGNGLLGWIVSSDTIYSAGLFCSQNHFLVFSGAKRCRIATPTALRTGPAGATSLDLSLDIRRGVVEERLSLKGGGSATRRWFMHRDMPSVAVLEIQLVNPTQEALDIMLESNVSKDSKDLTLVTNSTSKDGNDELTYVVAHPEKGAKAMNLSIVSTRVPATAITVPPQGSLKITLLCAVVSDAPFLNGSGDDTLKRAAAALASADTKEKASPGALLLEHQRAWADLWSHGGLEIGGSNLSLARQVNSTYYYLLSSVRSDVPYPIGPGGLTTDGYFGNGYWDNDVWAMPALLPSWPELARTGATYRYNLRSAAAAHARSHQFPGLFFPFQTAGTGAEVDLFEPANYLEQHVGGGVALLMEKLVQFSCGGPEDVNIAKAVVPGVSDFFVSRATSSKYDHEQLSINNVVPPDEFATGAVYQGVDDAVYMNAIAKRTAETAMRLLPGDARGNAWQTLLNLTMLTGTTASEKTYHLEYHNFPDGNVWSGGKVKQADVTMLAFPLEMAGVSGGTDLQRSDLLFYEPLYDPEGPAMTSSVSVVGWLELGEAERAAKWMKNQTAHIHAPFNVWTESKSANQHQTLKDEGCYNFMTGGGGFIQSMMHGYGGLRIRWSDNEHLSSMITLDPQLPARATSLKMRSISFAGATFSVMFESSTEICLLSVGQNSGLAVSFASGGGDVLRTVGQCVSGKGKAEIVQAH